MRDAADGDLRAGTPPVAGQLGLGLYAASARNVLPRVVSGVAVVAVASCYLNIGWVIAYGAAALAALIVGLRLARNAEHTPVQPRTELGLAVNSLVGNSLQSAMALAVWYHGDDLPRLFAGSTLFIGATYVLLHYYANLKIFRLIIAPYGAASIVIIWSLGAAAHWNLTAWIVVSATLASTANFYRLSRQTLHRSRTALRVARQRAEQGELAAAAANAAKSTFLATMSHEIRTPLNGVLGMAQAMAGDELSDRQRDRLSVVHGSGEALLAILNDVLDLSKIEAGKLELEAVEFDLGEVALGAYSAFTALANKKGLSFALDIDDARGRYLGDPTRLRQILYNLISNALKFTEQGEIRVTAVRAGIGLEITVRDTGLGIAPESLPKLFVKFDQLDSSTTRRFGGTGLGLSICHELVQLMGGELSVESEIDLGSSFTVRAPFAWQGEERSASPGAAAVERPAMTLRVLAAEDNAVNQLVLKTLLHQMGIDPVVVDNGADALAAWEAGDWDVILMDIQMPVMDGLSATARIRELERTRGRARTPIVALTANAMSHQVDLYTAAGMDGHVAKPIQAAELYGVLNQVIIDADTQISSTAFAAAC